MPRRFLSSPPCGGHRRRWASSFTTSCFYPVPRAGDISGRRRDYSGDCVSIQSPVRGTSVSAVPPHPRRSFYPVPRAGDIELEVGYKMLSGFYPVPRAGDISTSWVKKRIYKFLSSPPCGGHRCRNHPSFRVVFLSSPPCGGHHNEMGIIIDTKFLSSPPCGGHPSRSAGPHPHTFLSSPPCGGHQVRDVTVREYLVSIQSPVRGTSHGTAICPRSSSFYPVPRAGDICN